MSGTACVATRRQFPKERIPAVSGVLDANALFRFKGGQCVLRAMLAAIERKAEPP